MRVGPIILPLCLQVSFVQVPSALRDISSGVGARELRLGAVNLTFRFAGLVRPGTIGLTEYFPMSCLLVPSFADHRSLQARISTGEINIAILNVFLSSTICR